MAVAKKPLPKSSDHSTIEPIYQIWGWILLVWSIYRYFLKMPEWVDELVFKPIVFLGPVFWYVLKKEKRDLASIGITAKKHFQSLYIGLFFGFIFAFEGIILNVLKNGQLSINPIQAFKDYGLVMLLGLSLATAISEEILNRGFLFRRIHEKTGNLPYALFIATILFLLLHVPILVTSLQLQGMTFVLFFLTNAMMGLLNNLLVYQTGSIIAPILVHVFWNMTVALYF